MSEQDDEVGAIPVAGAATNPRLITNGRWCKTRREDLPLTTAGDLPPGVWVALGCVAYAASLNREGVRLRMPHVRMTGADVEAAARELALARFIRVREARGAAGPPPAGQHRTRGRFAEVDGVIDGTLAGLKPAEVAVRLILWRDAKPDGLARTGGDDPARWSGYSPRMAKYAVAGLVGRGLVRVVRRGRLGTGASVYKVRGVNPRPGRVWGDGSHRTRGNGWKACSPTAWRGAARRTTSPGGGVDRRRPDPLDESRTADPNAQAG